MEIKFRKATPSDVPKIRNLIQEGSKDGFLLLRSLSELYDKVRDFWVVEKENQIIGICGFHPTWEDLAEVRSLVVRKDFRNKGIGKKILEKGEKELKEIGFKRAFTLTAIPEYFEKLGYKRISKDKLPHKVWKDCLDCPYFPDCKEEALIKEL